MSATPAPVVRYHRVGMTFPVTVQCEDIVTAVAHAMALREEYRGSAWIFVLVGVSEIPEASWPFIAPRLAAYGDTVGVGR